MTFDKGDRVMTPGGKGTINWKRMAAPDFDEVAAYSVDLDREHSHINTRYAGTVYPAIQVAALLPGE